ncbi:hypothetical protein AAG570_011516 [Ranatra chinensis]|uniref:CCZ1/INTU second Longin domain-containing protein n=1 Tax=Ranatra chinensis TaxID=642074 RepID=A0ABD0YL44_9HEMI
MDPDGVVVIVCDYHAEGPGFDSLRGKEVLMISLPDDRCFCIDGNKECLDDFFKNVVCRMQIGLMVNGSSFACAFEELLPVSHWLPLPKEAQMHIDDSLNELEANDIWAYDHDMVAVLLESGGCTARFDGNPGPDVHYVEETQATLEHIHKIGIPRFMNK